MQIAILTFDGFNELDAFTVPAILNQLHARNWAAHVTAPATRVTSMNGIVVERQRPIDFAAEADAVIINGSNRMHDIAADRALLGQIRLDPARQLIGAQGSGALLLARLGFTQGVSVYADGTGAPWIAESGLPASDNPFHAAGHIATAGGGSAALYLAAWLILRGGARADAEAAISHVAPAGETDGWVDRAIATVGPFLPPPGVGA
ncbi:hypothetical protein [Sphingomonas sp. KC8]|uniref:hypothetical protein n=1 Tax=Sphingomonas sp. KC8 TaxID=1030157 RepID=UPI00024897D9|nr:hypothetical protein [Sphingomonas sp. KC8]ARS29101.1 AraC family transcriptional regulator [Sphingomonas sp. KC8]